MTPVGESLRQERLKRNLNLEEISHELKISTRFLQAIENDQYDKLPGGVFAKSFVRQYARLLGLDEEVIGRQMQQALSPSPQAAPGAENVKPAKLVPIQVPKVDEWETFGDHRFRWSGWLSAVALVAVMLVCSAVYAWMQRPKPSVSPQTTSPVPVQSAPPHNIVVEQPPPVQAANAPPEKALEPSAAPAPLVEQRPVAQREGAQREGAQTKVEQTKAEPKPTPAAVRTTAPNPDATVHVEITADETVWMLARADGKYLFSATVDAHGTRTVDGVKEVTLRLGNAGAVSLKLNGKPIGPAGPKGQVRTIQFTSGGFQIVPAKPPSAPLDRP